MSGGLLLTPDIRRKAVKRKLTLIRDLFDNFMIFDRVDSSNVSILGTLGHNIFGAYGTDDLFNVGDEILSRLTFFPLTCTEMTRVRS